MLVGFARASEHEKPADLTRQLAELNGAGCTKVFTARCLPKGANPVLTECLAFLREGDCLVACRPDRLTWHPGSLLKLIDALGKRGVGVVILSVGGPKLDTRDPLSGPAMAALRCIAQWRNGYTKEMQGRHMAERKARGGFKGSSPRISTATVREMASAGIRPTAIGRLMGIGRSSVMRHLGPDYRVTPKPKPAPRQRIDPATVQLLLRSKRPCEVARAMGISRSSVSKLRGY